jgi:hypothetical protein
MKLKNFLTEEKGKVNVIKKPHFTADEAKKVGEELGINWAEYDVEQFRMGMDVELEHGTINAHTNVTDDDPTKTGMIALAHLNEIKNYYTLLDAMEKKGAKATKPVLEATKVTHGKYVKFSPKEMAILKRHFDPKDFDDIRVSPGGASAAVYDTAGEEGTKFYVEKVQYKDEYVYTYAVTAFSEAGSDETLAEEESKPFDKEDLKLLEKTLQKMMLEEW